MRKTENECVDCGLLCFSYCQYLNVTRYYCDECGDEGTLYETEYGELCAQCLLKKFPKVEGSEW